MLKIFKDVYINFIAKVGLVLLLLLATVLFSIYIDLEKNTLFIILIVAFIIAFLALVMMINTLHKKLNEDIDALSLYLKKIDAKEYDAQIKIKNYLDFLELSLLLKNLVKRLVQKEKKSSKK